MNALPHRRLFSLSRRNFLKITGLGIAATATGTVNRAVESGKIRKMDVIRPRDLLRLSFEFRGELSLEKGKPWRWISTVEANPDGLLGIVFPPQHIAEGWINDTDDPPDRYMPTRLAGPSRLVFKALGRYDDAERILVLAELLRLCRQSEINPAAQFEKWLKRQLPYEDRLPEQTESVIEFPYRMFLAPASGSRFFHSVVPYARVQPIKGKKWIWIELWNSSLDLRLPSDQKKPYAPPIFSVEPNDKSESLAAITKGPVAMEEDPRGILLPTHVRPKHSDDEEALWAPDHKHLELALSQSQNHDGLLRSKQLMLTAMGATADLDYRGEVNLPGSLRQWIHQSSIGRDNYVRAVVNGLLMPFFHPAVLITIWERKLSGNPAAAILKERRFLLILEPERTLPASDDSDNLAANAIARGHVLKSVRIKEERSPILGDCIIGENEKVARAEADQNFWPQILTGADNKGLSLLRFECEGMDIHGQKCTFRMPMFFVVSLAEGAEQYRKARPEWRTAVFEPAPIAFAPASAVPIKPSEFQEKLGPFLNEALDIKELSERAKSILRQAQTLPSDLLNEQALIAAKLNEVFDTNELSLEPILRDIKTKAEDWIKDLHSTEISTLDRLNELFRHFANEADNFLNKVPDKLRKLGGLPELAKVVGGLKTRTITLDQKKNETVRQARAATAEAADIIIGRILVAVDRAVQEWVGASLKVDHFSEQLGDLIGALGHALDGALKDDFKRRAFAWAEERLALANLVKNFLAGIEPRNDLAELLEPFKALNGDFFETAINSLHSGMETAEQITARIRNRAVDFAQRLQEIPHPGSIKLSVLKSRISVPSSVPDPSLIVHSMVFQVNSLVDELGSRGLSITERLGSIYEAAVVESAALKRMAPDRPPFAIGPYGDYLREGFNKMRGGMISGVQQGIFAEIPATLQSIGEQIQGGVVNPAMNFVGLSREIGAVAGKELKSLVDSAGLPTSPVTDLTDRLEALSSVAQTELDGYRDYLKKIRDEGLADARKNVATWAGNLRAQPVISTAIEEFKKLQDARDQLAKITTQIQAAESALRSYAAALSPDELHKRLKAYAEKRLEKAVKGLNIGEWLDKVKFLGSLSVGQLLQVINNAANLPKTIVENFPDRVVTRWDWVQPLQRAGFDFAHFYPAEAGETRLILHALLTVNLPTLNNPRPDPPRVAVEGSIKSTSAGSPFGVVLFGVLRINFSALEFASGSDRGTSVAPRDLDVLFLGPLSFVADLQEKFKKFFGGGLLVQISAGSVRLGLELKIPPISCGIFSLSNISFSTSLALPLLAGKTVFRFSFCSAENKFLLSIAGFAGAGYLTLDADTEGQLTVEGALEFGGCIEFNVAVANGALYVMAGVYFRFSRESKDLSGYLRAGGRLSVLGIITVSVELYLGLQYHSAAHGENHLYGRAELKISIKLFFFKKTVSISFEKRFAGSKSSAASPDGTGFFSPGSNRSLRAQNVSTENGMGRPPGSQTGSARSPRGSCVRIRKKAFKRHLQTYRWNIPKAVQ